MSARYTLPVGNSSSLRGKHARAAHQLRAAGPAAVRRPAAGRILKRGSAAALVQARPLPAAIPRCGILGTALSYAGLAGRVVSESIGRDLNPLGRGDGTFYAGGNFSIRYIYPPLPLNGRTGGSGNGVEDTSGPGTSSPRPQVPDPTPGGLGGGNANSGKTIESCADMDPCSYALIQREMKPHVNCQAQLGQVNNPTAGLAVKCCSSCCLDRTDCVYPEELEKPYSGCCGGLPIDCHELWKDGKVGNKDAFGQQVVGMCKDCGGGNGTGSGGGGGIPGYPPGWGIMGCGVTGPWRLVNGVIPYRKEFDGFRKLAYEDLSRLKSKIISCLKKLNTAQAQAVIDVLENTGRIGFWEGPWAGIYVPSPWTYGDVYVTPSSYLENSECDLMRTIVHEATHCAGYYGLEYLYWPYYWMYKRGAISEDEWNYLMNNLIYVPMTNPSVANESLIDNCCCSDEDFWGTRWHMNPQFLPPTY